MNADNVLLKGLLEDVQRQKDKLENDFLAVNSEKLLLESQLDALRGGVSIEGYVLHLHAFDLGWGC